MGQQIVATNMKTVAEFHIVSGEIHLVFKSKEIIVPSIIHFTYLGFVKKKYV